MTTERELGISLEEAHSFLLAVGGVCERLDHLRWLINLAIGEIGDYETTVHPLRSGWVHSWPDNPGRDDTLMGFGVSIGIGDTGSLTDAAPSVTWGLSLKTTPRYCEVEADIAFETQWDSIELWSNLTTHETLAAGIDALSEGAEDLIRRVSFFDEIYKEHPIEGEGPPT